MKRRLLLSILIAITLTAFGQSNDPVIMNIAGQDILRSEFEYSYNKNNTDGVIDKKSVEEYVDLFINYKLKVQAALDEHMDTLSSYKKEFTMYRDQQIRPTLINAKDVEDEAHRIYDNEAKRIGPDGLLKPAHIFVRIAPDASVDEANKAKARIDSIYTAIKGGADFTELARTKSDDTPAAQNGGVIGWIAHGSVVEEFDKAAYALKDGEISAPVKSSYGYHIIKIQERKQIEPYDSLRNSIMQFIATRNINEQIIDRKVKEEAEAKGKSVEEIMDAHSAEMCAKDPDFNYLVQEYHDGLLLYEISNREVWDKAAKDEIGLQAYFKKHKKEYKWDEPRFKGMVYHVKDQQDVEAVKKCVKGLKFDDWNEALRSTFNADSVIRIRVEKGIFKKGDNGLVDRDIYGVVDAKIKTNAKYPIDALYGKKLNVPEELNDVKSQVVTDYQSELEKKWVAILRKKYTFTVNDEVLKSVNKH